VLNTSLSSWKSRRPVHGRCRRPLALIILAAAVSCRSAAPNRDLVVANDNRAAAGSLDDGVLTVHLEVVRALWHPESDSAEGVRVAAFAEAGQAPRIPGPLLRVPAGTVIDATVKNRLADSTIIVHGLVTRPADSTARDSLVIRPGDSAHVRFAAGAPGTYLYWADEGRTDPDVVERQQLGGAFVVDSSDGPHDDRVFVMNIWGDGDSAHYRNALAINGKAFPYTERIHAMIGDTVRWRWVNATDRRHPMHLHGFFFSVNAHGDGFTDTVYAPEQRRLEVTENMQPLQTMAMTWVPDRDGNWLFHCHIAFHVVPEEARFAPPDSGDPERAHESMSADVGRHMAGLVLGIMVSAPEGWQPPAREHPRTLRLLVQEGRRRGRSGRALGYVLQTGDTPPAPDSIDIPGPVLVLTRGQPTDITVVNHLKEATGVHWHGLELESRSDGVPGWSGTGAAVTPPIAPGDSFVARLTLARAGTFIYHTHLHDLVQLTAGLYGPIVVLEPGQVFDSTLDHVMTAGWDGAGGPPWILINGDSVPQPLVLAHGAIHRFRFVNIGPATMLTFRLEQAGRPVTWRVVGKDGAALPRAQVHDAPAVVRVAVGETWAVDWPAPRRRGEYRFVIGYDGPRGTTRFQRVFVR